MARWRPTMLAAALLAISLACGAPAPAASPGSSTVTPILLPSPPASPSGRMILGIEYAPAELAEFFAGSGAASAKPYPSVGDWQNVQSGPDASYDWDGLDRFVLAYQQAGFEHLTLMITARTLWAAIEPLRLGDPGDVFPRPEFEDDYSAYVQAFVERYDDDGLDDMPGLLYPVNLFGFEPEYSSYWPGRAETYIRLLELARPAVRAANPDAQMMAAGLLMTDVFDGYPTPAEIEERLLGPDPRIWHKSPADVALLLDHPELFDVIDVHSLGDYTEVPPTISWLRAEMAQRGYDRPIWIGDAFGGAGLNGWGPAACPLRPNSGWLAHPATEADRCRVADALAALADSSRPDHEEAIAWVRGETAAGIVRKVVVAAGEGVAGINIGNVEDWEPLMLTLGGAGTSPWQGMIDRNLLTREFLGYRPAYYALAQVAAIIRGYVSVERVETADERVYIYRFLLEDARTVIVAWADTGLYLPGEPIATRLVRVPWGTDAPTRLEWTVTSGAEAVVETASPENGDLAIELGQIPVFIWP